MLAWQTSPTISPVREWCFWCWKTGFEGRRVPTWHVTPSPTSAFEVQRWCWMCHAHHHIHSHRNCKKQLAVHIPAVHIPASRSRHLTPRHYSPHGPVLCLLCHSFQSPSLSEKSREVVLFRFPTPRSELSGIRAMQPFTSDSFPEGLGKRFHSAEPWPSLGWNPSTAALRSLRRKRWEGP